MLAWGSNNSGQLGDGTTTDHTAPISVPGVAGVSAIAAGGGHVLALLANGTVRAWGDNGTGELGDGGTSSPRVFPRSLAPGAETAIMIDAGGVHSVALLSDGTVRAWGRNNHGQLGDGTTVDRSRPVHMLGLTGITTVAAGSGDSLAL
jgi:alpha-tubulin suppressor-like RCC1 family protein